MSTVSTSPKAHSSTSRESANGQRMVHHHRLAPCTRSPAEVPALHRAVFPQHWLLRRLSIRASIQVARMDDQHHPHKHQLCPGRHNQAGERAPPGWEHPGSMIQKYYPTAFSRILAVESRFGVPAAKRLHIQMMSEKWGSGNPNANIPDLTNAFYDDHHCVKWTPGVTVSRDRYMRHLCTDSSSGNWPVITGEWSLSVADSAEWNSEFALDRADAVEWYRKWWTVQFLGYEKIDGWVYWTWKVNWIAGRNDWRWGYKQGVGAGVISKNPLDAYSWNACMGFT